MPETRRTPDQNRQFLADFQDLITARIAGGEHAASALTDDIDRRTLAPEQRQLLDQARESLMRYSREVDQLMRRYFAMSEHEWKEAREAIDDARRER